MKKHILLLFLLVGGSLAVKGQSTDNVDLMFPNLMMTRYHYDKMKEDIEKKGNNPPKSAYIKQMRNPAESGESFYRFVHMLIYNTKYLRCIISLR